MDFANQRIITITDRDNEHSVTMFTSLPFDTIDNSIISFDDCKHNNDFAAFLAFKRNVDSKVDELRRALAMAEGFKAMIDAIDETTIDADSKWTE